MKVLIAIFLLLSLLEARENPFFPSNGERELPFTNNSGKNLPSLKRATITLPSKARVLESVTVKYKNLDGSIESKTIEVENTIDWHLPIFISQSYSENTPAQNIVIPKIENSVKTEKKEKVKRTLMSAPKVSLEKQEKIATFSYADFAISDKSFLITTKDELIRNFLLSKPHRIVLDFKRDANIKAFTKINEGSVFSKMRIGNHNGYYRVVLELDGHYRYSLEKLLQGYKISLK